MFNNGRPYSTSEVRLLKVAAGRVPASVLAEVMGRSVGAIRDKIESLNLDGRLRGEAHPAAKLTDLQVQMIGVLTDAGFTSGQILSAFREPLPVTVNTLKDVMFCKTWRVNHGE